MIAAPVRSRPVRQSRELGAPGESHATSSIPSAQRIVAAALRRGLERLATSASLRTSSGRYGLFRAHLVPPTHALFPRFARLCVLAAALLACNSGVVRAQTAATERVLVDGRKVQGVRFEGPPWERGRAWIEGGGPGAGLFASDDLGQGDFSVDARLVLPARNASGAALQLGDSVFGFDGRDKTLFADGPLFGGKLVNLEDAGKYLQAGKPFDLAARRTGSTLAISIDAKLVAQFDIDSRSIGRVGFVSNRPALQLLRFAITGAVSAQASEMPDMALQPQVEAAIGRGVDWLLSMQLRDGSWRHVQYGFVAGQTALCAYTLLRAGLPVDHPSVVRAFAFLDQIVPLETYTAGLMTLAYEATRDPARLPRIKTCLAKILEWNERGQWGYPNAFENDFRKWLGVKSNPDLSNTQYAVLGMRAAQHAGAEVPDKAWIEVLERTLTLQEDPREVDAYVESGKTGMAKVQVAGFRYSIGSTASGSMTAAGLCVVRMCRDALGAKLRGKLAVDSQRALQLGLAWIEREFNLEDNPGGSKGWQYYYIYGLERVGTLLGVESFGTHRWYVEGAEWLLKKQDKEGTWSVGGSFGIGGSHSSQEEADTCFAILFLKRASRPTVQTGGMIPLQRREPVIDPAESVRLRITGSTTVTLWIDGFSDDVLAQHGGGTFAGLRVASVEYLVDGIVLKTLDGDPARAWDNDGFTLRHTLVEPGTHQLKARVHLVAPDAAPEAKDASNVVESKVIESKSEGSVEPWMLEAAAQRVSNLLSSAAVNVTASSEASPDEAGAKAFDGLQSTHWSCAVTDKSPMLVLEMAKPVKCDTIVLGQACASRRDMGQLDRITEISVRINREKDVIVIPLVENELETTAFKFDKPASISRLEIRVTRRIAGGARRNQAGFAEIALERRGRGETR